MSGFMSFQDGSSACLLTDGAAYDMEGTILHLKRKVTVGKVAKIAVTSRGNAIIGDKHQQRLCDAADKIGVDWAVECFAEALQELATKPEHGGYDFMHWHIVAFSETKGLVRYSAHNLPYAFSDGEQPLKLREIPISENYYAANNASLPTLVECGVTPPMPGESVADYLDRSGAAIMEAQRRTPAALLPGQKSDEPQYLIGGQCDLTIVTADAVVVKSLRTWPDRIGEKIDPFSETGNVVRMPRHQRRALARQSRKMARA